MPLNTPEFQQGRHILANLIQKAFEPDKGFHHFYERRTGKREGGLNDNDLGDFLPFLHYFGHIEVALNYLENMFSRYDLFFSQRGKRFGSTKLSRLGIIDLFSSSDFYQGLLFARQQSEYHRFHREIEIRIQRVIRIISGTNCTHFIKALGKWIPFPIFRIVDLAMYPEILLGFKHESESGKLLARLIPRMLKQKTSFARAHLMGIPLQKESRLMKDHTNLLFSLIRHLRVSTPAVNSGQLKEMTGIILGEFVSGNIIFNLRSQLEKRASSLAFAFLETLLESYLLTDDRYYLENLEALLPFWLDTLEHPGVFPVYLDVQNSHKSSEASVDPNTDFYVLFKKIRLYLGEAWISESFLNRFRKNIMTSFLDSQTGDVYSRINLNNGEKHTKIKSKFSSLFTKILIADQIGNQKEWEEKEIYLDDR